MKYKIPKGAIDTSKMTTKQIVDMLLKHPQMIEDLKEIGRNQMTKEERENENS